MRITQAGCAGLWICYTEFMSEETIKLRYSALSNITFHGEIDTDIPVSEWKAMSSQDQAEVIEEAIGEIIEIGVVGE